MYAFASGTTRAVAGTLLLLVYGLAAGGEIRVACYSDGNECEVTQDLAKRFEAQNAGRQGRHRQGARTRRSSRQLPVQLAAGEGPDIARVTDLGGLIKYYLDITPYVEDREVLGGELRPDAASGCAPTPARQGHLRDDDAAHRHRAVRQQDAVRAGEGAAARPEGDLGRVGRRRAQGRRGDARRRSRWRSTAAAIASRRSAISMGAKIFDAKGNLVIDDGYKAMAKKFVDWNKRRHDAEGGLGRRRRLARIATRSRNSPTAASSCTTPAAGRSRGWTRRSTKNFDWIVVPDPCGPGGCTGDARRRRVRRAEAHEESGGRRAASSTSSRASRLRASTWRAPRTSRRTRRVAKKGVDYDVSPAAKAALNVFVGEVAEDLAGRPTRCRATSYNRAIFHPTAQRLGPGGRRRDERSTTR